MKKKLSLIAGAAFLLFQSGAMAATSAPTLTLSATVPAATGISLSINKVVGTGSSAVWTLQAAGTSSVNFDALTLHTGSSTTGGVTTSYSYWAPDNYYVIDVGTTNGVGTPTVNITYADSSNPNGTTNGLGTKSGIAFDTTNTANNDTLSAFGRKTLASLTGTAGQMPVADIPTGYWERVYVGVCTGNTIAANGNVDPTGCNTFGSTDAPGVYSGVLTFTATAL